MQKGVEPERFASSPRTNKRGMKRVATSGVTLFSSSYDSPPVVGRGPLGIVPSSALRLLGTHVPRPPVGALPAPNQASGSPGRPGGVAVPLVSHRQGCFAPFARRLSQTTCATRTAFCHPDGRCLLARSAHPSNLSLFVHLGVHPSASSQRAYSSSGTSLLAVAILTAADTHAYIYICTITKEFNCIYTYLE